MTEGPITKPGAGAASSPVSWPAGPHYFDLTGSEGAVAWVRYRVWAADWYTRTLESVAGPDRNYDRLVGVEMALDGALNSLSSAFDAGTALIIKGAEETETVDGVKTARAMRSWSAIPGASRSRVRLRGSYLFGPFPLRPQARAWATVER